MKFGQTIVKTIIKHWRLDLSSDRGCMSQNRENIFRWLNFSLHNCITSNYFVKLSSEIRRLMHSTSSATHRAKSTMNNIKLVCRRNERIERANEWMKLWNIRYEEEKNAGWGENNFFNLVCSRAWSRIDGKLIFVRWLWSSTGHFSIENSPRSEASVLLVWAQK